MQIEIEPYNSAWPEWFREEADLIKGILGEHCLGVHHVGSTSVPQLCAKPKIDILCVIDELHNGLKLGDFGYTFKGEANVPLRYVFSKHTKTKINLHMAEKDHGFIALNLHFRDYLRNYPEARLAYADLKEKLLKIPSSHVKNEQGFTEYNLRKNDFIKGVLKASGFNEYYVNFCLHYNEWREYHRIREEQIFAPAKMAYDEHHPSISGKNHYHFVLYKGSTIVSVAQIELLNDTEAALRPFATDEPYKGLGHGAYLLQFVEKWVKLQNRKIIKLHANLSAEKFYRNFGYMNMLFAEPHKGVVCSLNYVDLGKVL